MTGLIVVGAQWGDEGKGKVIDVLSEGADVVARYSGGSNAGHTLVLGGSKLVTRLVPSGCRYPGKTCVLGSGMVIDPEVLFNEVSELQGHGFLRANELKISGAAHVVLPIHRDLDAFREDNAKVTGKAIGTTRRGIGPAYEAKAARLGIRVIDLLDETRFRMKLEALIARLDGELGGHARTQSFDQMLTQALRLGEWMKPWICDVGSLCREVLKQGKNVLFEGAQGALLDVDAGTYPYVTSCNTTAGAVCTSLGVGPTSIDKVWGVTKAYATRVGAGPFPTCLSGALGDRLREVGGEYGATTGRPRDCGWLDLVALKYAAEINGLTGLCLTKLDILARLGRAEVCVAYRGGERLGLDDLSGVTPEWKVIPGWEDAELAAKLAAVRHPSELPKPICALIEMIEQATDVPVTFVSLGADRAETLFVADAY